MLPTHVSSETSGARSLTWEDGWGSPVQHVCEPFLCDGRHLGRWVPWKYGRLGPSVRPAKPSFVCDTTTTFLWLESRERTAALFISLDSWNRADEQLRCSSADSWMKDKPVSSMSGVAGGIFPLFAVPCGVVCATCDQCLRSTCNCICMRFHCCMLFAVAVALF